MSKSHYLNRTLLLSLLKYQLIKICYILKLFFSSLPKKDYITSKLFSLHDSNSICKVCYNTTYIASRGLLNPPFLFMYCRYFLLLLVWIALTSLLSTCLFFVVLKPVNPIIFIISISSCK